MMVTPLSGRVRKKPLTEADIMLVHDLLDEVQPHQVFAAGDLSGEWAVGAVMGFF